MSASTTFAAVPEDKLRVKTDRHLQWKRIGRLAVLAAVIGLVATHVSVADLARAFTRLKPSYLAAVMLVLSPLVVLLRSLRWRYLLAGRERAPLTAYIGAHLIGVLASFVLLGKLGDLVKARLICRTEVSYGRSLAVVAIDRLLEGMALLLIFAAVLLTSPLPSWAHRLAWLACLASLGALATLRLMAHNRSRLDALGGRLAGRLPASLSERVGRVASQLLAGCEALRNFRRVLVALCYGLAVWAVEIAAVTVFLKAFSIPAPWFIAAPLLIVVLNFGMLLPISPGSVGVYQLLCAFTLSIWGVSHQAGLALGVAMQTILYVPLCLAGGLWLVAVGRRTPRRVTESK